MKNQKEVALPNFSQARRTELRRQHETEARRCQAQGKRVFARALVETRVREAQGKVVALESAAAIGHLWTSVGLTGWKKVFQAFGVSAPQEALETIAELSRRQLARLIEEDGPKTIALADEIASAIKDGEPVAAPATNGVGSTPIKEKRSLLPGPAGGGPWG